MAESPNIRYQFYKIKRGSEWWAAAQRECQRYRDWMTNTRKVAKQLAKLAGVKNDSFTYIDEGFRGKEDLKITGLQCKITGTPQSHGLKEGHADGCWLFRSNKLGKQLQALADSTKTTPFVEFLPESDVFPFGSEFIFTSGGLMRYTPKVYHSQRGPKRTVAVLGCDLAIDLEVPDLPDGVVQVTMKEANDFLNNLRSNTKKTRAKARV